MSSIDDTEAAINAAVDGPPPEEPEVEEVESGADDGAAESEPILGKFKSQDDLVKAYQELERQFTQQRQAEPEPEPEQPFDVWSGLGSTMDEETERQIAAKVYQNPQGMMEWAQHPETQQQFGADIADRVYATWYALQPFQAHRWLARAEAAQSINEPRQELEQLQQQWFMQQHKAESGEATRWAESNLPDWESYKQGVLELYNKYTQGDADPRIQTYDTIRTYLRQLYAEVRLDEMERQQQAAAAPDTGAGKKARTQTRSTAAPSGNVSDEDQQFLDEILAGQPGRN